MTTSTWYIWVFSFAICWIMSRHYREKFHINHFGEFKVKINYKKFVASDFNISYVLFCFNKHNLQNGKKRVKLVLITITWIQIANKTHYMHISNTPVFRRLKDCVMLITLHLLLWLTWFLKQAFWCSFWVQMCQD